MPNIISSEGSEGWTQSGCHEHMVVTAHEPLAPQRSLLWWTGGEAPPACQWAASLLTDWGKGSLVSHTRAAICTLNGCVCVWGWRCGAGGYERESSSEGELYEPRHAHACLTACCFERLRDHWEKDLFLDTEWGGDKHEPCACGRVCVCVCVCEAVCFAGWAWYVVIFFSKTTSQKRHKLS